MTLRGDTAVSVVHTWRDGWRRVAHAPAVVAGVFVATLLTALPLAIAMRGLIETHLGRSLMATQAAERVNWDWWQEFTSQAGAAGALPSTFTPSILGFAATLDALSRVLDAQGLIAPVAGAVAMYLLAWLFLAGGILDRYARQRRTRAYGFFAAAGVFFWRFLRLAFVAGVIYGLLYAYAREWLFEDWLTRATRDSDVERTAFAWRVAMYVIFAALLSVVNLLFDYAKVRLVVEDRRSAVGALGAALGFVRRNPGAVVGLYALNTLVFLAAVGVWALIAPGAGGSGATMWVGVLGAQLFILVRLVLKLHFWASETALFQRRLAHAAYTAAPAALWPDSPAAESIGVRFRGQVPEPGTGT